MHMLTVTVSLLEIAVKDRIARQSDTIQITKSHCEILKKIAENYTQIIVQSTAVTN